MEEVSCSWSDRSTCSSGEHIAPAPQWLQQQRQWWSAQRHRSCGVRHASMAIGRQPVPSSCLVALSWRPHFRRRRHPSSAALTRVRSVLCMCACGTCVSGADIQSRTSCGLYSSSSHSVHGSSNLCSCAKMHVTGVDLCRDGFPSMLQLRYLEHGAPLQYGARVQLRVCELWRGDQDQDRRGSEQGQHSRRLAATSAGYAEDVVPAYAMKQRWTAWREIFWCWCAPSGGSSIPLQEHVVLLASSGLLREARKVRERISISRCRVCDPRTSL